MLPHWADGGILLIPVPVSALVICQAADNWLFSIYYQCLHLFQRIIAIKHHPQAKPPSHLQVLLLHNCLLYVLHCDFSIFLKKDPNSYKTLFCFNAYFFSRKCNSKFQHILNAIFFHSSIISLLINLC